MSRGLGRRNTVEQQPTPLEILLEDEDLIACSKPPGLLVHRSAECADRTSLLQLLSAQTGRFLYPAHRLDRAASGAILFAFSSEAARGIQAALAAPEGRKEYLVLARGETSDPWVSERPLTSDAGVLQMARSEFRPLAAFGGVTLLEVRTLTGRRHQIRRHLAHAARHVIGDTTYGKGRINRWFREQHGLERLFLHARRVLLRHPRTGERLEVVAPLAPDLRAVLARLDGLPEGLLATL